MTASAGQVPAGAAPRIAYVISTRFGRGGAERLLTKLVEEGDRRGWQQLVVNPFAAEVPSAFAHLPSTVYTRRPCRHVGEVAALRRWVQQELSRFEPDMVHVMLFHALLIVGSLPRQRHTLRVLTHVYGTWIGVGRAGSVKRRLDRWAARRFDAIVAISESVREFLALDYGFPPPKVVTIPPGWEGEPMPSTSDDQPPTVVCVAQLRPEKRHDLLLTAFAGVRRQLPEARLVLVGDGDMRGALTAHAEALGIGDGIEFTGPVREIWPHLAAAHVFALASQSEAFGMAIVEAMAAGLPVVAPDIGAIPELVRPGVNGELFPPGDDKALAEHLVRLLDSPQHRSRMAEEARRTADGFSMTKTLPQYFDLYAELLEGSEGASVGPLNPRATDG